MDKRLGRFRIKQRLLQETPGDVFAMWLSQCAVVSAEYLFEWDAVEYLAWNPHFRLLGEREEVPFYEPILESWIPCAFREVKPPQPSASFVEELSRYLGPWVTVRAK